MVKGMWRSASIKLRLPLGSLILGRSIRRGFRSLVMALPDSREVTPEFSLEDGIPVGIYAVLDVGIGARKSWTVHCIMKAGNRHIGRPHPEARFFDTKPLKDKEIHKEIGLQYCSNRTSRRDDPAAPPTRALCHVVHPQDRKSTRL